MNVTTAINERRSVRAYRETAVEDEKLNLVLEASRLSPSARNRQEWKFVVVRERDTLERLAEAAPNGKFLASALVAIVACATEGEYVMSCGQLAGTVDTSIALAYMILQAHALGLGTCWLGGFSEEAVKDILAVPTEARVVAITPLGYPAETPTGKPRKPLEVIVSFERYS